MTLDRAGHILVPGRLKASYLVGAMLIVLYAITPCVLVPPPVVLAIVVTFPIAFSISVVIGIPVVLVIGRSDEAAGREG